MNAFRNKDEIKYITIMNVYIMQRVYISSATRANSYTNTTKFFTGYVFEWMNGSSAIKSLQRSLLYILKQLGIIFGSTFHLTNNNDNNHSKKRTHNCLNKIYHHIQFNYSTINYSNLPHAARMHLPPLLSK